jgi:inorganic pyrophosphatase
MDDHIASLNIMCELGLSIEIIQFNMTKTFVMNERTALLDDFNLKIGAYCDQRMAPDGIMPILDRLKEAKERAGNNPYSSMNHPRVQQLIDDALKIEQQILEYVKLPSNKALNTRIEKNKDSLRSYLIETDTNIIQPKTQAIIEIPKGTSTKYGFKNNELVFENELPENLEFTFNYGFIPFTMEDDEEELDVFVIDDKTLDKNEAYEVTILGAIEMYEDGIYDPKLIAACNPDIITSQADLQNYASKIKAFLNIYKNSKNQHVVFGEVLDGYDAVSLIRKTLVTNID